MPLSAPTPPGWRPLGPDDELLLTLPPDEEVWPQALVEPGYCGGGTYSGNVTLPRVTVRWRSSSHSAGVGRPGARYLYSGEVRWRFGGWLYAVGQGGTLLFPAPDGALHPGAFASLGLGVDHAR